MSTIENLINQFSRENLNSFFKSKSDTFTLVKEEYHSLQFYKDYFENPFFEGKINEGTNHTSLCVFSIKVKKPLSERSSKRKQFEIARKILRQELVYQGGFFVFYDNYGNFRLSFIFTDEKIVGDKLKTEFSNFRRFTYFVEPAKPNRTFRQQISTADFDDFQSILEAFSVEKVTKEFYKEIQQWYDWARQIVLFPNPYSEPNSTEKNLIRLITRLIFVWFMREKNLIPNDIFDPNTIKNLLNFADKTGSTYYKAILQNLFFATLNTEMKKDNPKSRIFVEDAKQFGYINDAHLQQGYYRYSRFIKDKQKFLALFENVPFLNGGLFESLDYKDDNGKEIRIDCFSDNPINEDKLKVPDFLFFSDYFASNRKALFEQSNGFIDILKRYNFTVDENSPIDADIALDPELLGKIFESLLAEFNPETQTTARKASGSYYTPREIVDYMVEEALIGYLEQKFIEKQPVEQTFLSVQSAPQTGMSATQSYTSSLNQKLRSLLSYDDASPGFESDEVQMLIDAIDQIKILDPACGSGAFPMGILHKLVWVLHKLDPDNEKWKEKLLERIPDTAARENLKNSLKDKSWDYIRKLGLIQNCIFGIDLQEIAVQISKLRFFISLLIEQEPDPNDKNFGIMPLPNLETKFVAANTLIGLQRENSILSSRAIDLEQKLFKIREKIFYSNSSEQKKKLRKDEKQVREELRTELENIKMPGDVAEKIASWDPFDQNSSSAWFDPEFMFGVRDGFDIVIGNPPYIQLQKNRGELANLYKNCGFETLERTGDIYCLFYEKGLQLLKSGGILCFITSNKWMRAGYGGKLRQFFLKNNPLLLIDLGPGVFENATVDTNILLIQKDNFQNKLKAVTLKRENSEVNISRQVAENSVHLEKLTKDAWFIGSSAEQQLKEKIERMGKPLKDWDVNIYYGIKTGLNEAFIITTEKRNEILANCKDDASTSSASERKRTEAIIKPILRGRDIKRYYYKWAGLWVIATFPALHLNINDYPAIKKYFLDNFDIRQLEQSGKKYPELGFDARKKTGNKWFETQDQIAYYPEFEKEKVVWAETDQALNTVIVSSKFYLQKTCFMIISSMPRIINALLNSQLTQWYIRIKSSNLGSKGMSLTKEAVQEIPIPPITTSNQPIVEQIEALVDKILASHASAGSATDAEFIEASVSHADTSEWEREIDRLVYQLYDLTEEEIRIIENK